MRFIAEAMGTGVGFFLRFFWIIAPLTVGALVARYFARHLPPVETASGEQRDHLLQAHRSATNKGCAAAAAALALASVVTASVIQEAPHFARAVVAALRQPLD